MGQCKVCGKESELIASFIGVCRCCLLQQPERSVEIALRAHASSRRKFGIQPYIPKGGLRCKGCGNECEIAEGQRGYCNLVCNEGGKLKRFAGAQRGLLSWYYDPHVTNCVAAPWCPAGTGCGYPRYAYTKEPEYGYYNLAVFMCTCNFDCLFCCNWHWRFNASKLKPVVGIEELARAASNPGVSCVCYFGGVPGPQLSYAIKSAELIRKLYPQRLIRFCLEENGNMNPRLMHWFAKIALETGGSIKIDLKSFNEAQHIALCGVSNRVTLKNFEALVEYHCQRPEVPFLYASTPLIPGYVEVEEVEAIAKFIAELDPTIPYNLLAFDPLFELSDLPYTSRKVALECYRVAKQAGLQRVRIGNLFLLR